MQNKKILVSFITSGMTISGKQGLFLGEREESLLDSSKEDMIERANGEMYPRVSRVYSSSQRRSLETAYIIYPKIPAIVLPGFNAFGYGDYEGMSCGEVLTNENFRTDDGVQSSSPCPKGEDIYAFQARISHSFQKLLKEVKGTKVDKVAVITHKEVIMPIIRKYCTPRSNYSDYPIGYGDGVTVKFDEDTGIGTLVEFF